MKDSTQIWTKFGWQVKKAAPYSYYLPSSMEIEALQIDDRAKLIFRSLPAGREWEAERMWVKITERTASTFYGVLESTPSDMPQLKIGHVVKFEAYHIIDYESNLDIPRPPSKRWFWERCMVDNCVLDEGVPVYYIYREEPDLDKEGDTEPDSGWRIRGDYRNLEDEAFAVRKASYIAIAKVFNQDDSWLPLIDSPIGSAFIRNFETGVYEIDVEG